MHRQIERILDKWRDVGRLWVGGRGTRMGAQADRENFR